MPSKEIIIDNIGQYTPRQIVDYLKKGVLTIQDILNDNPAEYDFKKRLDVEKMLWDDISATSDSSLAAVYITNYPAGKFIADAERLASGCHPEPPRAVMPDMDEITYPEPLIESADPWDTTDKTNIDSLNMFLELNPDHPMAREARKLISDLIKKTNIPKGPEWLKREISNISSKNPGVLAGFVIEAYEDRRISSSELRDLLSRDHNFLSREVIEILVDEGILSTNDLLHADIDKEFVDIVSGTSIDYINSPVETNYMVNPDHINQVCQEIYFWGMPSSGKTCALGAILSAASTGRVAKTIEKNSNCNGYDYMRQLSEIFQPGKISVLPTGTSASFVSDMSFWLLDNSDKLHSITMVDLAGEMLHAMYLVDQNRFNDLSPDQLTGYNCMKNLLVDSRSKNSKIHFFVLEYGGHERREKGIRQVDMLDGALSHIKNLGILRNTDAVFILMTKADKAFEEPGDVNDVLQNYVKTHYQAFYNNLRLNAQHINGGKVEMIPFSIGEVCFQDLCRFDDETANDVVRLFLERTVGEKTGKIGKFTNTFRG